MNIKKKFGSRIVTLRKRKGISQERLGFISKIHRTYISEIERGETNVSLEHIEKLSIALGVSLSHLFCFDDKSS